MSVAILWACLLAQQSPMTLLGPPEPVPVTAVAEIDASRVMLLQPSSGQWVQIERSNPMLLVARTHLPGADVIRLHLNSGESLPGRIDVAPDEDHIAWRHPWLGRLVWPLEQVAGIAYATPPAGGVLDVLTLDDGDRHEGFCASIGTDVVMEVELPDGRSETLTVPWGRIHALHLADARMRPPVGCSGFIDGTVVRLGDIRRDTDEVLHHAAHPATTHAGLGAPSKGWVVLALGDQVLPLGEAAITPATSTSLPPLRGSSELLKTGPIRLRGEGSWALEVPPGMDRLRAQARIPEHLRHLAGGALIVEVDGEIRSRVRLDDVANGTERGFVDVDVEGIDRVILRRTLGPFGEVGATVEIVDGVLSGPDGR